jgi:type III pantothenate kinase
MTLSPAAVPPPAVPDAILVDVGSSRVKFALAAGAELRRLGSAPSQAQATARAAAAALDAARARRGAPGTGNAPPSAVGGLPGTDDPLSCVITSVKPELNDVVRDALSPGVRDFRFLGFGDMPGLAVSTLASYVAPDRLANIVAAAAGPCPAIVADLGTATTVDVLDAGHVHLGGAIMAGVQFTGGFLATMPPAGPQDSILGSHAAARHAAAVYAHAGAIDRLCELFTQKVGPARIVATGGLAAHVVPHCRDAIGVDGDLTFRGTRLAHISWCRAGAPMSVTGG